MCWVADVLNGALAALAGVGILYTLTAAVLVRRRFRPAPPAPFTPEPVTILKPLHGAEGALAANLETFVRQDYPGPVQIVFGVQSASDPAAAVVEELRRRAPDADIELVIDTARHGANGKISNLVNMAPLAKHDLLVIADADIVAPPDYLARLAAAAQTPGAGLVTCFYHGAGAGFWARFAAMGVSYGFLPSAVLGESLGLAHPCMGATIALRRERLAEAGGFAAYADELADDYALGADVRAMGGRVVLPGFVLAHELVEESLTDVFAHEARWAVTIRSLSLWGYACSIATHPLPLALIAVATSGFSAWALALAGAALAARLSLADAVDRAVGAKTGPRALLPLRDIASFATYLRGLFASRVEWRGAQYRVSSDGKLAPSEG